MEEKGSMTNLKDLPEQCIAEILSYTTPVDACRLSLVSKAFRSAAEYDIVWDHFFPSNLSSIIPPSSNSKKALYFTLLDFRPTIIDNCTKSYQLDKRTGKKCYMFSARDLTIESNWHCWTSQEESKSRFEHVARLPPGSFFDIYRMINTSILSPNTQYTVFLVFKFMEASTSFQYKAVGYVGCIGSARSRSATYNVQLPNERRDGWLEIEIGNFNSGLKEDQVPLKVKSIRDIWTRSGFIIEGIELRPFNQLS